MNKNKECIIMRGLPGSGKTNMERWDWSPVKEDT